MDKTYLLYEINIISYKVFYGGFKVKKYIFIGVIVLVVLTAGLLLLTMEKPVSEVVEEGAMANEKAMKLQDAINEFGAATPEDAALIWSKGVQERSGALQYSVMSKELKKAYKESLDKNFPNWVTGVSSPWVDKYEIVESKAGSNGEHEVTVKLSYATSTGSAGEYLVKLYMIQEDNYWVINNIEADDSVLELNGLDFLKRK
jgi:hypothetical protein